MQNSLSPVGPSRGLGRSCSAGWAACVVTVLDKGEVASSSTTLPYPTLPNELSRERVPRVCCGVDSKSGT
jgi:hypothetical protein